MKKHIFLLKIILGTIFAVEAGGRVAFNAEYSDPILGNWLPTFIYTFYPLACIVIMQWLLLSDYLPKWWITLGLAGCVIAGIAIGSIFYFVSNKTYDLYSFELSILRTLLSGLLLAVPQLFILKGRKGYLWVLANGIGWTIQFIAWYIIFIPPIQSSFLLAFLRMLILESPRILFGLAIGLYLYTYIYNPSLTQANKSGMVN